MDLKPGEKLGPYEILPAIGEGGMVRSGKRAMRGTVAALR